MTAPPTSSLRLSAEASDPISPDPQSEPAEPIYVTRPYLPPLADYVALLEEVWSNRILTNGGPFHQQLEARLAGYLDVPAVSLTANGALALEIALEAAGVTGDVVTTPYSFVATTHAVRRGGLRPVFADIDPGTFNLDPARLEEAITPRTSAIVAVHCYGTPCDVAAIEAIARRHGIKVIYDAAHAFGVRLDGRSLFTWGDYATVSFHATKVFQTFEGGAVCVNDGALKPVIDSLKNFGIASETSIPDVGTNAKMSELHAAMGVLQLAHFDHVRACRAAIASLYRELLAQVPGITVPVAPSGVEPNYAYFPVLVEREFRLSRDDLYAALGRRSIHARRYFYPLLSTIPAYVDEPSAAPANLPIANEVAAKILCLPIFPDLSPDQVHMIVDVISGG